MTAHLTHDIWVFDHLVGCTDKCPPCHVAACNIANAFYFSLSCCRIPYLYIPCYATDKKYLSYGFVIFVGADEWEQSSIIINTLVFINEIDGCFIEWNARFYRSI